MLPFCLCGVIYMRQGGDLLLIDKIPGEKCRDFNLSPQKGRGGN